MGEKVWSLEQLVYHSKSEDPEVRFWAAERLVRDYPDRSVGPIALLLLDDHDQTPNLVAEHLGRFGSQEHYSLLTRAFRRMGGQTPGLCFEALVRLGYPEAVSLARGALERGSLPAPAIAMVLDSLASLEGEAAKELVRETLERRVELLVEPLALKALLQISSNREFPEVVAQLARALQWRGLGHAGDLFRTVTDHLEVDDCGWCIRTGPDGRLDLDKTIRSVESCYDCEILAPPGLQRIEDPPQQGGRVRGGLEAALRAERAWGLSTEVARELNARLRSGDPVAVETGLEAFIRTKAALASRLPGDTLPDRIAAFAAAIAGADHRPDAERLGPAYHQWVVSSLLSCAVKLARYRNYALEVERAEGNLDALLALLQEETAFLSEALPSAIARASADPSAAIGACVRLLESRGPFFPKVLALETLGALRADEQVPEMLDYLADENSYIYMAAERALAAIGDAIVPAARARIQARAVDPDSTDSLLMLLSRLGTRESLDLASSQLEFFLDETGAGNAAEWLALFGAQELLEPLRRVLSRDPARVGQAVLLVASIHNVRVPEESSIRAAIEDYWRRQGTEGDGEDEGSGRYVM